MVANIDLQHTAAALRQLLADSPKPVPTSRALKALKPTPTTSEFDALVEQEVSAGRLFRFPGKPPLLWDRPPVALARARMLEVLAETPSTEAEVLASLKVVALAHFTKAEGKRLFVELTKTGVAIALPPYLGTRTVRYSVRAADPTDYLRDAVARIARALRVPEAEVQQRAALLAGPAPAAPTPPAANKDLKEQILAAIHAINPRAATGALVAVRDLRARLNSVDKATFDAAVLALADAWTISLYRTDRAKLMSDQERAELVWDEPANKHYNALSLRLEQ